MTNEQQRAVVSDMYTSPRWKARVKAMSDGQVFAIYKKSLSTPKKEKS